MQPIWSSSSAIYQDKALPDMARPLLGRTLALKISRLPDDYLQMSMIPEQVLRKAIAQYPNPYSSPALIAASCRSVLHSRRYRATKKFREQFAELTYNEVVRLFGTPSATYGAF